MSKFKIRKFNSKNLKFQNMTVEEMENALSVDVENADVYKEAVRKCKEFPQDVLWNAVWKISLKSSQEDVGIVWNYTQPENNEVKTGIYIVPEHRQKGFASEALKFFAEWTFSQKEDFLFITYEIDENNPAHTGIASKMQLKKVRQENDKIIYEKERGSTSWTGIFMCFGVSIGMSVGLSMDNMSMGMCIGVAIGVAVGSVLDGNDKKKRSLAKEGRYHFEPVTAEEEKEE